MSRFNSPFWSTQDRSKGYSWLFFYVRCSWVYGLLVTLVVVGGSGIFYAWYSHYGDDPTPNGIVGLSYALAGITFLLLAAVGYGIRRRSSRGSLGQLNAALNWHVFFAIMGLALLVMHSFGNFNPRSGTYALYSMIALTVSGFLGRVLDRVMPRLMAGEVHKALTEQGEDRIESISQEIQDIVAHKMQAVHGSTTHSLSLPHLSLSATPVKPQDLAVQQSLSTPWDLAYISLEETPQKLSCEENRSRLIANGQDILPHHGTGISGAPEQLSALKSVQWAMRRERFYRYVIRYWRVFHFALALLTISLTIWHLVYAVQFLLL